MHKIYFVHSQSEPSTFSRNFSYVASISFTVGVNETDFMYLLHGLFNSLSLFFSQNGLILLFVIPWMISPL